MAMDAIARQAVVTVADCLDNPLFNVLDSDDIAPSRQRIAGQLRQSEVEP